MHSHFPCFKFLNGVFNFVNYRSIYETLHSAETNLHWAENRFGYATAISRYVRSSVRKRTLMITQLTWAWSRILLEVAEMLFLSFFSTVLCLLRPFFIIYFFILFSSILPVYVPYYLFLFSRVIFIDCVYWIIIKHVLNATIKQSCKLFIVLVW